MIKKQVESKYGTIELVINGPNSAVARLENFTFNRVEYSVASVDIEYQAISKYGTWDKFTPGWYAKERYISRTAKGLTYEQKMRIAEEFMNICLPHILPADLKQVELENLQQEKLSKIAKIKELEDQQQTLRREIAELELDIQNKSVMITA